MTVLHVCIIYQKNIEPAIVECVKDAVTEVFSLAQDGIKPKTDFLVQEDSDDWEELINHTARCRSSSISKKLQLDAEAIIGLVNYRFLEKKKCKYALYIVSEDLFSGKKENDFIVGASNTFRPAIVSTYRFSQDEIQKSLDEFSDDQRFERFISNIGSAGVNAAESMRIECIKTVVMHEMGHVLSLLPESVTENIANGVGGIHCSNICVMRPGMQVPDDWIDYTLDRIQSIAFCSRCLSLLRNFLQAKPMSIS